MTDRPLPYMQMANVKLIEELYGCYKQDPEAVDASWRRFFEGFDFACAAGKGVEPGDLRIFRLIESYRRFGHLQANINPINLSPPRRVKELSLEYHQFSQSDLDKSFPTYGLLEQKEARLGQIIEKLEKVYCGTIGFEYMGIHSPEMDRWIQKAIEPEDAAPFFSKEQKKKILNYLSKAELFETFLHTKYVGQKRFSLEGCESLIAVLAYLIEKGLELGLDEYVIGMAHRGRLNVLANILNKSFSEIFGEFEDYYDPEISDSSRDVKYHKGFSANVMADKEHSVHISLNANASHLESVDPIVQGKVKAKQIRKGDSKGEKIAAILIHGDASFAGQGVVYEALQLFDLDGYKTGGALHIIINNQIGFTTLPYEYCSGSYCTDVALGLGFCVFHVNAEDPEGCLFATELALRLRKEFKCDVVIELNGYRKYGHNEGDEPAFTQPLEYQLIRQKTSVRELYLGSLINQGILQNEEASVLEEEFKKALHYELEEMKLKKEPVALEAFGGVWKEYRPVSKSEFLQPEHTAVESSVLRQISAKMAEVPPGFELHKKLLKLVEDRKKMGAGDVAVDWAMAELLAFGSLLLEQVHVRLAGQDCQRGTFTQRHAVWVDQKNGEKYFSLAHLSETQGVFTVINSPLSEYAALGFEYGYSLAYPSALVLWEAQYGDFANGAQVIFDQYIAASAQKWQRYSGLVVLLPHGYEGQGPEHSSARLERFLQLAGESNIQVAYPTTPVQYFHLLRRQIKRKIRAPLIVMTPKGLLRHAACVSSIEEFTQGRFYEILDDVEHRAQATRLLFCTGHIYYDLLQERQKRAKTTIAIIRIEQLYPLHYDALTQIISKYKQAKEYYWVQEEPQNMGAYGAMSPLLHSIIPKRKKLHYVGRTKGASPATGSHNRHLNEHRQLMDRAFE